MNDFKDDKEVYLTEAVYEPGTGRFYYQTTTLNGLKHAPPDGSPSHVALNREGSTWSTWHAFGREHRTDGPSSVITHPNSDLPMTETFMLEGRPRPPSDGPWLVRRDHAGSVLAQEFADEDHDPQLGPKPT